jgi:hypothetical protein
MSRELRALYRSALMASLLATAGCLADKGVAPAPNYELPSSVVLQKTVYSNSTKYSDKGHKATNQKGIYFQISAIALLDKQGVTHLAVTTGNFEDPASNVGIISKVQVKAISPDNKLIFNRMESGLTGGPRFNKDYTGLARNTRLELTVTVRDAPGVKVDQFAVTTLVKLQPDVAVSQVDAPPDATINTPVNIATTITEMNGDLGARTDCVLIVDGIETDRARGIWVDVSSAVSCAFTHSFAETGERELEVRASNVLPTDYDYSNNNTAKMRMHVNAPPGQVELSYTASASQLIDDVTMHTSSWYTSADQSVHSEATSLSQTLTKQQSALLYATLPKLVTFPITRLEVTQGTGGQILHNGVYDNVASSSSDESSGQRQVCATADAPSATGVVSWYVCTIEALPGSTTQPQTAVQYARYAGQVTYHSESYSLYWDNISGESVWSDNSTSYAGDETWIPFGSSYDFTLSITDGSSVYSAAPSITLVPESVDLSTPESCFPGSDEFGSWSYCEKLDRIQETLAGERQYQP